jgi:hypothetical protein
MKNKLVHNRVVSRKNEFVFYRYIFQISPRSSVILLTSFMSFYRSNHNPPFQSIATQNSASFNAILLLKHCYEIRYRMHPTPLKIQDTYERSQLIEFQSRVQMQISKYVITLSLLPSGLEIK